MSLRDRATNSVPAPVRRAGGRALEKLFKYAKRVPILRDRIQAEYETVSYTHLTLPTTPYV